MKALGTCLHCGKVFRPGGGGGRKGLFCSREHVFAHKSAQAARRRADRLAPARTIGCDVCGSGFQATTAHQKRCSAACRSEALRRHSRQISAGRKQVTARVCAECGCRFVAAYGDKRRTFCSRVCLTKNGRKVGKARARARRAGVLHEHGVTPTRVFVRDGWRCQLCGVGTPKSLRGTYNDRAPEVDHIVPLSRGGGHTWANVQCACRKCNGAKSDKILGQLRLAV